MMSLILLVLSPMIAAAPVAAVMPVGDGIAVRAMATQVAVALPAARGVLDQPLS